MELNKKKLSEAIKSARIENKLTQEQLSEIIDVSSIHIKQMESCSRKPSIDVLYKLAVTLNLSIDDIFFPRRKENVELLDKIERKLRLCNSHDLYVIYSTANALIDKSQN